MDWRKKEQERLKANLANETFVGTKGELRWKSNPKSVIPLDVFRDAGVTPPAAQAERRAYNFRASRLSCITGSARGV